MSSALQANLIEEMLEERGDELPADVRERMALIATNLRTGRREEMIPPNIPVDEPIPGSHPDADLARAESPTGDLPRTDRAPVPPPEEIMPPHAFATATRRKPRESVGDLNPQIAAPIPNEVGAGPPAAAAGRRAFPPLPTVERAVG